MSEIKEGANGTSVINSDELQIREYQINIANECVNKNSLVVLPTGLGKTIIAVLVANKILKKYPPQSKVIILAPTRPLINQHYETFLRFLKISEEKLAILTGKILPKKRKDIFDDHEILFYTPQTLRNDLVLKKYKLDNTALIIFDEAHHASGDYAYTMIADEFIDHNPDGIILGLTASPGSSKNKINALCDNLHIPVENIHIRTRKDEDVKTYLKPMDIYKIGVDLTSIMEDVYKLITLVLEERLHYLSQLNFLETKGDLLHMKVIRKDLLKLNSELIGNLKKSGDKTGVYSALSINAQALTLYHMLELIEQQGLDVLLDYITKLYRDAKKKNSSKATKILASDGRLQRIYLELKKNLEFSPKQLAHPKYEVLVKIILEELKNNPSSRILVFVKLRNSVKNIVNKLKSVPSIEVARFVGQTTKSHDDKGLSQKQQIEILDLFKKGLYNTLVGTNVAEEGLDIAECDLVIFYDVVASEIRLIQRKGRTARHREGKVVILYSKGTRDEIYLKIALSKLRRMNFNLKAPQQLKSLYEKSPDNANIGIIENTHQFKNKKLVKPQKDYPKKIKARKYQAKLNAFIENTPQSDSRETSCLIKISKFFPMKFGLRKRLQMDKISYDITESDLHIVIYNKVLIQIYNPKNFNSREFITEISDFKQISSLLILIFDFIEFFESFEGEKRLLKRKIQEFAKENDIQVVAIDNEEELYFIVKNILNSNKRY
ncbi:MAG: DEAD/DEAH box helicase family protein [Promethearchaeota archaeon]